MEGYGQSRNQMTPPPRPPARTDGTRTLNPTNCPLIRGVGEETVEVLGQRWLERLYSLKLVPIEHATDG